MSKDHYQSNTYNNRLPVGEILAMILFLAGLIMSLVCAIAGAFLLFQATRAGTISQETEIVGITGCFCFLVVSLSWLYLRIHDLND